MTRSLQELFAYISSQTFNPEVFERDLRSIKDLTINAEISGMVSPDPKVALAQKGSTLLGEASRVLNVDAVRILVQGLKADPNVLTCGDGKQIWTPVFWALYGSAGCSAVSEWNARFAIVDLLRDAGANMENLSTTPTYPANCKSLMEYAAGAMSKEFYLHGGSPAIDSAGKNHGGTKISHKHQTNLDEIRDEIARKPEKFLYITLHPKAEDRVLPDMSTIKTAAFEALKAGVPPKMGDTYTKNARDLLKQLTDELKTDPSLLLRVTLHSDTKMVIEQNLLTLGTDFKTIEAESYKLLTHAAAESKIEDGYTRNATDAIAKLHQELKVNPTLFLYYTLNENTESEIGEELQSIKESARKNLEKGASPREEGAEEYTANAKEALQKIAASIKVDPTKFLLIQLDNDAESEIVQWLNDNDSSIESVKAQAYSALKVGKNLIGENGLTTNGQEAIKQLSDALNADSALWLHISLNKDAIETLSTQLVISGSSLDIVKKAAVNMLSKGENPVTNGAYTENSLEAIGTLKENLDSNGERWLDTTLDSDTESKLINMFKLDIIKVKAAATKALKQCGLVNEVPTANAIAIITSIADSYVRDGVIPQSDIFAENVALMICERLHAKGRDDLKAQVRTDVSVEVAAAMDDVVEHAGASPASHSSTKSILITPPKQEEASSTWSLAHLFGWSSSPKITLATGPIKAEPVLESAAVSAEIVTPLIAEVPADAE